MRLFNPLQPQSHSQLLTKITEIKGHVTMLKRQHSVRIKDVNKQQVMLGYIMSLGGSSDPLITTEPHVSVHFGTNS